MSDPRNSVGEKNVSVSQIRTVPSSPLEAIRRPSGLKITALTPPSCPRRFASSLPVSTFEIRTVPS